MSDDFFSNEEIVEMEKRTLDRILEAIENEEPEKAKKLSKKMYNEFLAMHDLYRNWITATLSEVGRKYGDEALEEIMTDGCRAWWAPLRKKMDEGGKDLRAKLKMFVSGLHGHLQPLEITEDQEKITIKMKPCGSGGRLIQEGLYEGENGFLKMEKPHRLNYHTPNFPVYCAHESAMERIDIEDTGSPFIVVEPTEKLGKEHCSVICYKNKKDIPAKYYERLGYRKPE